MKVCFLCSTKYWNWDAHKNRCIKANEIHSESVKFVYIETSVFCKDCQQIMDNNQQQIIKHRKNCKKILKRSKKTKSMTDFSQFSETVLSWSQEKNSQQTYPSQVKQNFKSVGYGLLNIFVDKWIDQKSFIHPKYLIKIFCSTLETAFNKLYHIGSNFTMQALKKYPFVFDIIKKADDIFKVEENTKIIQKLNISDNVKKNIYTIFNQILKQFSVEERYQIARSPQVIIERDVVLYKDLMCLVIDLFKSKQKNKIHIALDLLIIFHSGQRFPSSIEPIKQGLLKNPTKNSFKIISTKYKKQTRVFFSSRLIHLLKKFRWNGFFWNYSSMKNIKRIANFSLINLRRGMYIQGVNANYSNIKPEIFTGHKTRSVAEMYISGLVDSFKSDFHKNLKIPTTQQQFNEIKSYQVSNKIKPSIFVAKSKIINWEDFNVDTNQLGKIEKLLFQLSQCDGDSEREQFDEEIQHKQEQLKQEKPKENDIIPQSIMTQNKEIEYFQVQNSYIKRTNLAFDFNQPFVQEKDGISCIYCRKKYSSFPTNFCSCFVFNQGSSLKIEGSFEQNSLKLSMPVQYLKNQYLFKQIRYLIHRRGFHVTNTAIVSLIPDEIIKNQKKHLKQIILPHYHNYTKGLYFPPLVACLSGDNFLGNSGVGLMATQDIQQDIFIGQYGGDILPIDLTILLKRKDMSMDYSQSLQICAFKNLSYVQLINSSKTKANCKSLMCVIQGQLKIIIYSSKKITAGTELLYDYQGDFGKQFEKGLSSTVNILKKFSFLSIPNGCFANALEYIFGEIYENKIPEIMNKRKCVEQFYKKKNEKYFSQQDFREYYDFLLDKIKGSKQDQRIDYIKSVRQFNCPQCKTEFKKQSEHSSLLIGIDNPKIIFDQEFPNQYPNQYKCENCLNENVSIRDKITSLPQIFFVFIQRIDLSFQKIQGQCAFYEENFIFKEEEFKLRYVVMHLGENNAGHYVVLDKNKNMICNDGKLERKSYSEEDLAYSLVYIKQKSHSRNPPNQHENQSKHSEFQAIVNNSSFDNQTPVSHNHSAPNPTILSEDATFPHINIMVPVVTQNTVICYQAEDKNVQLSSNIGYSQKEDNQKIQKKKHSSELRQIKQFEKAPKKKIKQTVEYFQGVKLSKFGVPIMKVPTVFQKLKQTSGILVIKTEQQKQTIIFERNSHQGYYTASLIKLLTVLTSERLRIKHKISYKQRIYIPEFSFGTCSELSKEQISFINALQLIISASANDVALGLFNFFKKREINLIQQMQTVAKDIGLENTYIQGCVGIEQNYSTCTDIVKLFRTAKKDGIQIFMKSIVRVKLKKGFTEIQAIFRPPYPMGFRKTGKFMNGRESIVFEKNQIDIIVVLLNSSDRQSQLKNIAQYFK